MALVIAWAASRHGAQRHASSLRADIWSRLGINDAEWPLASLTAQPEPLSRKAPRTCRTKPSSRVARHDAVASQLRAIATLRARGILGRVGRIGPGCIRASECFMTQFIRRFSMSKMRFSGMWIVASRRVLSGGTTRRRWPRRIRLRLLWWSRRLSGRIKAVRLFVIELLLHALHIRFQLSCIIVRLGQGRCVAAVSNEAKG